jgi:RND superfamily putative drug exporter
VLYRWGIHMYRRRWLVIGLWAIIMVLALPSATRVTSVLSGGFGRTATESQQGLDILNADLELTQSSVTVAFFSNELSFSAPPYQQEVERILEQLKASDRRIKLVETPYSSGNLHMTAPDGHTIYAVVHIDASVDEAQDMVTQLRSQMDSEELEVWLTGGIPIYADLLRVSEEDLRRAESVAFPVILLVLILVFGSLVAAFLPLLMGLVSMVVTSTLIYFLALNMEVSTSILNIVTLLGLGVAVDYALLVVNRFREELLYRDVEDALGITIATAGKAVLFSAFTSILGFSGLLFFEFTFLRSLGIGGVTIMVLSVLIAMTLLPAFIGVLGRKVNALPFLRLGFRREVFWRRLATWVMRHPVAVILPMVAFLLLLGSPFLQVNLGAPWAGVLPADVESREGWELLSRQMGPGELSPIVVVYRSSTNVLAPQNVAAMFDLTRTLDNDSRVERIESLVTLNPSTFLEEYQILYSKPADERSPSVAKAVDLFTGGNAAFLRIYLRHGPTHEASKGLVKKIRSFDNRGDMSVYVTGATADLMDTISVMYRAFPLVIVYVLAASYLVLFGVFRSLLLPLKAVMMNSMSIFASYGALVFIFQQGHFQGLLGFSSQGITEAVIPIALFCIIFGLSMDYEVFLLTRIKEIYDETGDNTDSVAQGLQRTGGTITSAALVMVVVCASFALADVVTVKAVGVGLGLAILIDATLVRALLVPALMRVMGPWNWWAPRFLRGATTEKMH